MISYKNETKSHALGRTQGNVSVLHIPRPVSVYSVRTLHDSSVLLPDQNHLVGFRVAACAVLVLKEAERDGVSSRGKSVLFLWDGKGAEGGRGCQERGRGYGWLFLFSFSEILGYCLICPKLTL